MSVSAVPFSSPPSTAASQAVVPSQWPAGFSGEPTMKISEVLAILRPEFPSLSSSRLRYYDSLNVLTPSRGRNGYRVYSVRDVERLRYLLTEQRDNYRPLRVIAEQLTALDKGVATAAAARARVLPKFSHSEVADIAAEVGCDEAFIASLIAAGLLPLHGGYFDQHAVEIAAAAFALAEYGLDPRHLRKVKLAAERNVDIVEQLLAPLRAKKDAVSQGKRESLTSDIGELMIRLHAGIMRSAIRQLK